VTVIKLFNFGSICSILSKWEFTSSTGEMSLRAKSWLAWLSVNEVSCMVIALFKGVEAVLYR
jgi:hypothetical protein